MKRISAVCLFILGVGNTFYAQQPTFQWLKNSAFGSNSAVVINKMVVSKTSGNIFVSGQTDIGDANFSNGIVITDDGLPFRRDGFIAKFDANANPIWVKEFDHADQYGVGEIALDSADNFYLVARSEDSTNINNIAIPENTYYWMKYDSSGNYLNSAQFTTTLSVQRAFVRLAVNHLGESFMSFLFNGTIGIGSNNYISNAGASIILKLDNNGVLAWSKQINTGYARDLAVNSIGNVLYAGQCGDNATFDSFTCFNSTSRSTPLIAELSSSNGIAVRIINPATPNGGEVTSIHVDANDNYYFGGEFGRSFGFPSTNVLRFANDTVRGLPSTSSPQISDETGFIAKANSNGQASWAKRIGYRSGLSNPYQRIVGAGSNLYLIGEMFDSLDLQTPNGKIWLTSFNSLNSFVASINSAGEVLNARPTKLFDFEFKSFDCNTNGDFFMAGVFKKDYKYSLSDSLVFTGTTASRNDSYIGKLGSLDSFNLAAPSNLRVAAKGNVNPFLYYTDLVWTDNSPLEFGFAVENETVFGSTTVDIYNTPNDTTERGIESYLGNVLKFSVRSHLYDVVSPPSNIITDTVGPGNTTFLTESNLDANISIYPNPSSGIFNIKSDVPFTAGVLDLSGRTVLENFSKERSKMVDLSSFKSGVYLLQIKSEKQSYVTRITLL